MLNCAKITQTRQDKTRQDKTRQDKTRQDKTVRHALKLNTDNKDGGSSIKKGSRLLLCV